MELDEGEYIVVPRTSGCNLRKIPGTPDDPIPKLLDPYGDLTPLVDLTVKDIFRRLDKVMINNSLDYQEFQEFYTRVGLPLSQEEFNKNILRKFCSNENGVNRRGFNQFFKAAVAAHGEPAVWRWLERWGYDRELYSQESRSFMLTFHSLQEVSVKIEEVQPGKHNDFDFLVNTLIIQKQGKETEKRTGQYRLLQKFYE